MAETPSSTDRAVSERDPFERAAEVRAWLTVVLFGALGAGLATGLLLESMNAPAGSSRLSWTGVLAGGAFAYAGIAWLGTRFGESSRKGGTPKGGTPSGWTAYGWAVLDGAIGTGAIWVLAQVPGSESVFPVAPATLLFSTLILLSSLHLRPGVPIFTAAALTAGFLTLVMSSQAATVTLVSADGFVVVFLLLLGTGCALGAGTVREWLGDRERAVEERATLRALLARVTTPDVADLLSRTGGAVATERRSVTVLFVDLRGFSDYAEDRPPEEVVRYLDELFGWMSAEIVRRGGEIHQLLGDGLMAVFGAPEEDPDHCINGFEAACGLVRTFHERGVPEEGPRGLGVGLATGEAAAGLVGSDLHREYKVTGAVVQEAARMEKWTRSLQAEVLLTPRVAAVVDTGGPIDESDRQGDARGDTSPAGSPPVSPTDDVRLVERMPESGPRMFEAVLEESPS